VSCEEFDALMGTLVDGEGSEAEATLREHARSCGACAGKLDEFRRLRGLLRCSAVEEAPGRARLRALVAVAWAVAPQAGSRANPPAILTPAEVADYLRVREEDVRRMVHRLPHFVVGGQIRFRRQSLESWIEREEQRQNASVFTTPTLALLEEDEPAWPLAG